MEHGPPPEHPRQPRVTVQRPSDYRPKCPPVPSLRASKHGPAGDAAPVHPHLFHHARVRQIVRSTRNLPLAQRQAGWSRLQMAYLTVGDEEARQLMGELKD